MAGEIAYQRELVKKIENVVLPGSMVIKTDPRRRQGILDFIILFMNKWASLEVKISEKAPFQPNQPYYVDKFNDMSFAAVIHPGNEEQVLNDLQEALRPTRKARVPKSK